MPCDETCQQLRKLVLQIYTAGQGSFVSNYIDSGVQLFAFQTCCIVGVQFALQVELAMQAVLKNNVP
jgi:hypothetical protein